MCIRDRAQLDAAENEQLDPEDLPDFVFDVDEEFDVLLEAEAEALGVLYVRGKAAERTLIWLEEWEAAAGDGAPQWLWLIDAGPGEGSLRFRRHSSRAGSWKTVLELPSHYSESAAEKSARKMIRRVFSGYIPADGKFISFDDF